MASNLTPSGPGDLAWASSHPRCRLVIEALGQLPDGEPRGIEWLRNLWRSNRERADVRAQLASDLASAQAEDADLRSATTAMARAIRFGVPYLPQDPAFMWPSGWLGRSSFVVCGAGLVGLELSSAANISALTLPIVQSTWTSWAMCGAIAVVPAAVKLLLPPYRAARVWVGILSILASLVYAVLLSGLLNTAGDGMNLGAVFQSQLLAEAIGMAALSCVLTKIVTPRASPELLALLEQSKERLRHLAGEIQRLQELIRHEAAAEEAFVSEGVTLIQLAAAPRIAEQQSIARLNASFESTLAGFIATRTRN